MTRARQHVPHCRDSLTCDPHSHVSPPLSLHPCIVCCVVVLVIYLSLSIGSLFPLPGFGFARSNPDTLPGRLSCSTQDPTSKATYGASTRVEGSVTQLDDRTGEACRLWSTTETRPHTSLSTNRDWPSSSPCVSFFASSLYLCVDWRVDLLTSSNHLSMMSVPTVLVDMKLQPPASSTQLIAPIESFNFELSPAALTTLLNGLEKIQTQLSAMK